MSVMAVRIRTTQYTDGYRIRVWNDEKAKSNNKVQHRDSTTPAKKG